MTTDHFIPRSRTFWIYHGSALAVSQAMMLYMILNYGELASWQIASSIAWPVLFTLAVLMFRWMFKWYAGEGQPVWRLICAVIVYSLVAAFMIALALQWTVAPFYWRVIEAANPGKIGQVLHGRFVEDFANSQLMVAAWAIIYLSITSIRRVRQAELSNLKLENALKDARLSSLVNQLNPHFLFNALNNVRFMMYEDVRHADTMITALSEVLRYSLDSSRHDKIALGQELAVIQQYIDLVAIQLEDRLAFSMDIAEGLHGALIPPMVLQMLVENAIKHGLEPLPQGGSLSVVARSDSTSLMIEVRNATPAESLQRVGGMGIGLRNIEQRLQLLYGDQARLELSREAAGFTARLTIPRESA
ncbi:MAG: histidine kinase [Pseudomonadota bacterium]